MATNARGQRSADVDAHVWGLLRCRPAEEIETESQVEGKRAMCEDVIGAEDGHPSLRT